MRFQDRVVLITGAAQGIGRGCAEVFFNEGGGLAIVDRNVAQGMQLCDAFNEKRPGAARFYACDVGDSQKLTAVVEQAASDWGRLDSLINNAGYHPPDTSLEATGYEELMRVLQVNFVSTFMASQAALKHLRKTRGTIINISSMTAVLGQKNSAAYAATKGAQLSFTKALAVEVGGDGIRVNAILPSNVDTPLMHAWAATLPDPQQALQRIADLQVFGRMASIQEIGKVCLFLATDDSSFITGQGIEVEGGASLDY